MIMLIFEKIIKINISLFIYIYLFIIYLLRLYSTSAEGL